tara:strand:- start:1032 stop:1148 length:117 start_codon:yes stop_codon:yes gene_type:complete
MIKNEMKEISHILLEVALKPIIEYKIEKDELMITEQEF